MSGRPKVRIRGVQVLHAAPGDVLFIQIPEDCDEAQCRMVKEYVTKALSDAGVGQVSSVVSTSLIGVKVVRRTPEAQAR